jgi:hypothetical protein
MTPFLPLAVVVAWVSTVGATGADPKPADAAARLAALCREGKGEAAQAEAERLMAADKAVALDAVTRVLWDRDLPCRTWVLNAVYRGRLTTAAPLLIALLDDPDRHVRIFATQTLGELGDRAAVAPVGRLLTTEPDPGDRHRVRVALARLGRPYLGYYIDGLRDRDPQRCRACVFALQQLKDPRSVPHLMRLLDGSDTWESRDAAAALEAITGVPAVAVTGGRVDAKGRPATEGWIRRAAEVKDDCAAWVARHREAVNRPVPPPAEKWEFTPEPHLPGLGVSFTMTPADVRAVLDKAGVKYTHRPARLEQTGGGNATFHPEQITADRSLLEPFNAGLSDFAYMFKDGRLDEVRFTHHRDPERAFAALMKPLGLRHDARGGWTGLDGAIGIGELFGDSEKAYYSLTLNFRPR